MSTLESRILLVDDDAAVLRVYAKTLAARGWAVETAADGEQATRLLQSGTFAAVVSDVSMPEMDGLQLLRGVRERGLDVPVILMTGGPAVDSAIRAVEYGAFRYLLKPVAPAALTDAVDRAVRLHALARLKQEALEVVALEQRRVGDRAGLEARFSMALRLVGMMYQPIVALRTRSIFGYEALVRSAEPTLRSPGELLDAAERLGRVHDLGRTIRRRICDDLATAPPGVKLFVNLHSLDLNDEDLYVVGSDFARNAARTVLEITERASLDGVPAAVSRVAKLRTMGFQIAVDDLGAGYAGLTTYSQIEPEIAKIDMSLVRGIDREPRKRSIVASMKRLCDELGTLVVVEGVETTEERDALAEIGCDLMQGYLFARPERGFPLPRW